MAWMLMVFTRQGASGETVFSCHIGTIKVHKLTSKHHAKEQQHQWTAAARPLFQQQLNASNRSTGVLHECYVVAQL
eukprot:373229-Pelagomonas_calceolata.AAC.5